MRSSTNLICFNLQRSGSKSKDTLISQSAVDAEGYEDKADDIALKNDEAVRKAE